MSSSGIDPDLGITYFLFQVESMHLLEDRQLVDGLSNSNDWIELL